jgi:hypothetical protein
MNARAANAHVHGAAKMQIAIDGNSMEVELAFPLESLVGFERTPRTDKERKTVQKMREQFNEPKAWLIPSVAAQCVPGKTEIHAPVLESKSKDSHGHGKHHEDEHAELEAVVTFHCAVPAALKSMEVRLFDAFPRLQHLKAEIAAPGKQSGTTLDRKHRTLSW